MEDLLKMQNYIGSKHIKAFPLTRGDYNNYRGWKIPNNENPKDPGYLVEYIGAGDSNHPNHVNYISWSPSDVFERAYQTNGEFTLGNAVEFGLNKGFMITRMSWIGHLSTKMLFLQVPASISVEETVPVMTSLPTAVKEFLEERRHILEDGENINYSNQIAVLNSDNTIHSWSPSAEDLLSKDWKIINFNK